ncbi:MAG: DUF2442 domain-containing protein, partial [Oscillospiraceae bacterium]|nr:DUF2442 domain-containing protein [Oscillospiraceae bacterium]
MKIFAIRDETDTGGTELAWLLYYETEKRFYIELPENADPWSVPLVLSSFLKKGETSVNSYWSRLWVQQRIVPPDRQNIGQILRDNGLKEYDEYGLLMLAMGRCAQDDYYLAPVDEKELPVEIVRRFHRRVEDVVPLRDAHLLLFFRDGSVRKCGMKDYFAAHRGFAVLRDRPELFSKVQIQTGGHGVFWDENLTVSDAELYRMGEPIPLTAADFYSFAAERVINAAEAAEILNCSRQYINELVRKEKL